ncbi:testis-expressed protein 48 isoform X4 [Pongo abelii]|uniref:testis-expressed protein 48 isoform X4 n=1 Tax=Pongo abelii TaxID=9601 RepID=UPI0023E82DD3|nr:testis-expressed protein 48 isoform X4 [Pongo abelii]
MTEVLRKQPSPVNWAQTQDWLIQQGTPADKAGRVEVSTRFHGDCQEPYAIDDSKVPSQTQEHKPSTQNLNAYASQRNFYKRNLNRYCQERWPFQPCLVGRP